MEAIDAGLRDRASLSWSGGHEPREDVCVDSLRVLQSAICEGKAYIAVSSAQQQVNAQMTWAHEDGNNYRVAVVSTTLGDALTCLADRALAILKSERDYRERRMSK